MASLQDVKDELSLYCNENARRQADDDTIFARAIKASQCLQYIDSVKELFDEWLDMRREDLARAGLGNWVPSDQELQKSVTLQDVCRGKDPQEQAKLNYIRTHALRRALD